MSVQASAAAVFAEVCPTPFMLWAAAAVDGICGTDDGRDALGGEKSDAVGNFFRFR
jgi:hypothetical protein